MNKRTNIPCWLGKIVFLFRFFYFGFFPFATKRQERIADGADGRGEGDHGFFGGDHGIP